MRKEKRSALLLIVLLLLVTVSALYVSGTYAKYTAEITGTSTVKVAKWAFESDNSSATLDIDITPTANAKTLVADRIAPGTEGSFAIDLVNTNSEVGVDFTVEIGAITGGVPANLAFYKDSAHSVPFTPGTDEITGQIAAGDSTGVTVEVYWAWEYYTSDANDALDTTDGEAGATLSVPVTITGIQTTPSTTAITSHVD